MINFIIYPSTMKQSYERTVSKLRFYKKIQVIRLFLKLIKFDSLARPSVYLV